jgi:hypothetical protein
MFIFLYTSTRGVGIVPLSRERLLVTYFIFAFLSIGEVFKKLIFLQKKSKIISNMLEKDFNQSKIFYLLAGLVFVVAVGFMGWFGYQYFFGNKLFVSESTQEITRFSVKCDFARFLDGVCVDSVEKIKPKLVAVMIENHTDARPQSGLADASIVYEAPVEANFTRFMAIYPADEMVKSVGPVRSARPYYLNWLAEYGSPMYMHCGGSAEALEKIVTDKVFDFNEMYNGQYFWRSDSRYAPHNLYTSNELWNKAFAKHETLNSEQFIGWQFASENDVQTNSTTPATEIKLSFLVPSYVVEWKYNSSTFKYERYQVGAGHYDSNGTLITADTVIVQHVNTQVLDDVGRLAMDTIGTGLAEVYYNGEKISGTWKKTDRTSRTRFYGENGEEIKLKAGKIWVEVFNR